MIQQPKYDGDPRHGYYKPLSYQALAVTTGAVVTPTIPETTRMAKVFFRGGITRITLHAAGTPAAAVGVPFSDGYEEFFSRIELDTLKLITETENAEVHFIYYG